MRKLVIRFTVGFVTFLIGLSIAALLVSRAPSESDQVAQKGSVALVGTISEDVLPSPETRALDNSGLSLIIVESGKPNPQPTSSNHRSIKLSKLGQAVFDLDLGEDIDNQEVSLNFRDSSSEYRMFERYRTSMSISAEGPHLDLVNWRHFDSPWIGLPSLGVQRFRMLPTDQIEGSKFPPTTKSEIIKEVRRHVGNDWPTLLELVKDCSGPNEGACFVSVSSIYLRIQKKVKTGWLDISLVEVRIPMGC